MIEPIAPAQIVDVTVENSGGIFLFRFETAGADAWVEENIADGATWYGGALVVESRYAIDLAKGLLSDGLVVR